MNQKPIADVFWSNVAGALKSKGISMTKFSLKLDLNSSYFSTYKSRKAIPSAKLIEKIADYLELSYEELFADYEK